MAKPEKPTHSFARGGGDRVFLDCEHCGDRFTFLLPCSLTDASGMMKVFSENHATCKAGPRNLFEMNLRSCNEGTGETTLDLVPREPRAPTASAAADPPSPPASPGPAAAPRPSR